MRPGSEQSRSEEHWADRASVQGERSGVLRFPPMTAEVAIMNAQAIALAADSAVTFGRSESQKIFTNANKIFTLSKYHPVGVMIYGNARLIGTPWETVIKRFRGILAETAYPTLEEYAAALIDFLRTDKLIFHPDLEEDAMYAHLRSSLAGVAEEALKEVGAELEKKADLDAEAITGVLSSYVSRLHAGLAANNPEAFPVAGDDPLLERFRPVVEAVVPSAFRLPLTDEGQLQLTDIANYILRGLDPSEESGLVVAGFGADEVFPTLIQYRVRGVSGALLNFEEQRKAYMQMGIYPFAQRDVVDLFVGGVDPQYQQGLLTLLNSELPAEIDAGISEILANDDAAAQRVRVELPSRLQIFIKDRLEKLTAERRSMFSDQMVNIIAGLPKEELAGMAESLVSLTSLRRKVSYDLETVGGPIDVAVISKGDGFIWIKRKHYFDPALNPHFFANYFRK